MELLKTLATAATLLSSAGAGSAATMEQFIASDFGYSYDLSDQNGRVRFYDVGTDDLFDTQTLGVLGSSSVGAHTITSTVKGSLRNGSIGLAATGSEYGSGRVVSQAVVRMKDQLFFDLTGYDLNDTISVTFGFSVEATFRDSSTTLTAPGLNAGIFVRNETLGTNSSARANLQYGGRGTTSIADGLFREDLLGATQVAPGSYELELELLGGRINSVFFQTTLSGQDGVSSLNSANSTIKTDIAFTSASGVFLSSVTPVPLPAGMPLLLGGLAAFSVIRRKRKTFAS